MTKTSSYCNMLNKQSLPRLLIACLRPVALFFANGRFLYYILQELIFAMT